jgi:hypothetical protein
MNKTFPFEKLSGGHDPMMSGLARFFVAFSIGDGTYRDGA